MKNLGPRKGDKKLMIVRGNIYKDRRKGGRAANWI